MLDFLDPSVVQKVVSSDPNRKKRGGAQWDKYNKEGKMIIEESESEAEGRCFTLLTSLLCCSRYCFPTAPLVFFLTTC